MKKLKVIIIALLIAMILSTATGFYIKAIVNEEDQVQVFVCKEEIKKGDLLSEGQFEKIKINALDDKNYLKNIETGYASVQLKKGQIMKDDYISKMPIKREVDKGQIIISFAFDEPERANAWIAEEGDDVLVYYTPKANIYENANLKKYALNKKIKASIYEIKDQKFSEVEDQNFENGRQKYLSLQMDEEDAFFLSEARDYGAVDILIQGE